jgi:hypothetical protein
LLSRLRWTWWLLIHSRLTLIRRLWLDDISHYLYVHWSNRNIIHVILFIDFFRKRKWNQVNTSFNQTISNLPWRYIYSAFWPLSVCYVIYYYIMILFKQLYWSSCCHLTFRKIWYCLIKTRIDLVCVSSVFVLSILFWFPQRTHYFWRVFRFLFMEHKQDYSWHL